jgi:hypothetical protein
MAPQAARRRPTRRNSPCRCARWRARGRARAALAPAPRAPAWPPAPRCAPARGAGRRKYPNPILSRWAARGLGGGACAWLSGRHARLCGVRVHDHASAAGRSAATSVRPPSQDGQGAVLRANKQAEERHRWDQGSGLAPPSRARGRRAFQLPMKCSRDAAQNVFWKAGSSRLERGGPLRMSLDARAAAEICSAVRSAPAVPAAPERGRGGPARALPGWGAPPAGPAAPALAKPGGSGPDGGPTPPRVARSASAAAAPAGSIGSVPRGAPTSPRVGGSAAARASSPEHTPARSAPPMRQPSSASSDPPASTLPAPSKPAAAPPLERGLSGMAASLPPPPPPPLLRSSSSTRPRAQRPAPWPPTEPWLASPGQAGPFHGSGAAPPADPSPAARRCAADAAAAPPRQSAVPPGDATMLATLCSGGLCHGAAATWWRR